MKAPETMDAVLPTPAMKQGDSAELLDADPVSGLPYDQVRSLLGRAVEELRARFDAACARANLAAAQTGNAQPIAVHRAHGERRYSTGDPATDPRYVALFVSVPARDGHIFGGAFVNTSATTPSIYLVPRVDRGTVCWTVWATGAPFTDATAADLFACAFRDNPEAKRRLQPLSGYDLFQLPWS